MKVHTCNLIPWEVETGGPGGQGQPGVNETLPQNENKGFTSPHVLFPLYCLGLRCSPRPPVGMQQSLCLANIVELVI